MGMEQEMKARNSDGFRETDEEKWVYDSSLDHKGKNPLRTSTGAWKAAFFIIAIEFSERLTYFGIATNLIMYLTGVLQEDLTTAAKMVNYWQGVTTMMPLVGGFLADAYTGRFLMIMIASIVYLMGLILLTLSEFIPMLKPCKVHSICSHNQKKIHEATFFLAMYLLALATGGHKPCLESFGADQYDDDHPRERKQKMSFFNWWNFSLCSGLFLGVTLIVYVQDHLGWGTANLILTITLGIAIIVFYCGKRFYRYRLAEGSPLMPILQVLVAAMAKRNLSHTPNPDSLYEIHNSGKSGRRLLSHTNTLRFLDRAAIVEENQLPVNKISRWRLATVTQVEETKLVINMIPIWLTSLIFGICLAQSSTFFVKQSSTLDRRIGHKFEIPPATVASVAAIAMLFSVSIYDKALVPFLRRTTGNERGISILSRIGIGMVLVVIAMATAALVEQKRLRVVEKEVVLGGRVGPLSMSVFWLAPQYIILGIGDSFSLVGLQEYFYEQVPDSMRSLGIAFYLSILGAGSFISSFLISCVDQVTEKGGKSWLGKDLNSSRLDRFYWLTAAICALNLLVYVFLAKRYSYKNVHRAVFASNDDEKKEESLA